MRARAVALASLLVAGCAGLNVPPDPARAELRTARGDVVGAATFTQVGNAVRVVLEVQGLPPGVHGVRPGPSASTAASAASRPDSTA